MNLTVSSIGTNAEIEKRKPEQLSTTKLNIETAVANVLPWNKNPRRENPEVNRATSPTPNKNDAMHRIIMSKKIVMK